jgi:3-oxoadipate enol-lactonase
MLKDISAPTLLIFGEDDKITNTDGAEEMRQKIADSRFYKIENAGHFSNLEQTELFNKILIDFVNRMVL